MSRARDYNTRFQSVIYHSNSRELVDFYNSEFQKAGLTNIEFNLTPYKK